MENKLDELIAKIKEKGVLAGEKEKESIIAAAKEEAQEIIARAQAEAEEIKERAEKEANNLKAQTKSSLQQAKRDIILALKQEIKRLCARILEKEVSASLDKDFVKKLLEKMISAWQKDAQQLEVVLSKELEALQDFVVKELQKKAASGIKVTLSPTLQKGFYVKKEGEDFYYDFSDASLAEIISEYLSPKISEILQD